MLVSSSPLSEVQEDSSSSFSWHGVWQGWRAQLSAARARLSRQRGALAERLRAGRVPRDMRGVYRQLLGWAAAHGHARRSVVTPLELAEELGRSYPERSHERQALTAYYNGVRYGAHATSPDELADARALLEPVVRERATH